MCRAGGRRCPNAGGHPTQDTRQAVSRARKALREAKNAVNQHHDEHQDHAD
jgi:hypothetical protein